MPHSPAIQRVKEATQEADNNLIKVTPVCYKIFSRSRSKQPCLDKITISAFNATNRIMKNASIHAAVGNGMSKNIGTIVSMSTPPYAVFQPYTMHGDLVRCSSCGFQARNCWLLLEPVKKDTEDEPAETIPIAVQPLIVHYLAWHRAQIPQSDLDILRRALVNLANSTMRNEDQKNLFNVLNHRPTEPIKVKVPGTFIPPPNHADLFVKENCSAKHSNCPDYKRALKIKKTSEEKERERKQRDLDRKWDR